MEQKNSSSQISPLPIISSLQIKQLDADKVVVLRQPLKDQTE
jgi:hypothetical protein